MEVVATPSTDRSASSPVRHGSESLPPRCRSAATNDPRFLPKQPLSPRGTQRAAGFAFNANQRHQVRLIAGEHGGPGHLGHHRQFRSFPHHDGREPVHGVRPERSWAESNSAEHTRLQPFPEPRGRTFLATSSPSRAWCSPAGGGRDCSQLFHEPTAARVRGVNGARYQRRRRGAWKRTPWSACPTSPSAP
jgi:hypothetical protein